MNTFEIELVFKTDYDLMWWEWDCPGCGVRVGQDPKWKSNDVLSLTCPECLYGIRTDKPRYTDKRDHEGDCIQVANATTVRAPTRMDLLRDRDTHATELSENIDSLKAKLIDAAQEGAVTVPLARTILRLAEQYDKHMKAYEHYLKSHPEM